MTTNSVATPAELAAFGERLRDIEQLAVDTEFVRVRTYFPVLCLIQINDGEAVHLVDTLACDDLDPLMTLFCEMSGGLILHAGRQDFEALYQHTGRLPRRIWDTQIAAAMLGHGEQVSYAQLVHQFTGIELAKSQTRTNWAQRPLSEEQLRYAAEDVAYLHAIKEQLEGELATRGRTAWLEEECAALLDTDLYKPQYEDAWRRCKMRSDMNAQQRGAWEALCALRERRAVERNRPRRWLLDDAALESLATTPAADRDGLRRFLKRARAQRNFSVDEIVAAIDNAPQSTYTAPRRPDAQQQALIDRCLALVKRTAKSLDMSASMLATRRDVTRLVRGDRDVDPVQGWRRGVIGDTLLDEVG